MIPGFLYSISFPLAENYQWQLLHYTEDLKNAAYLPKEICTGVI